jgi:hypothetical protein
MVFVTRWTSSWSGFCQVFNRRTVVSGVTISERGEFHDQGDAKWLVLTAIWGVARPQGGRPAAVFFPLDTLSRTGLWGG